MGTKETMGCICGDGEIMEEIVKKTDLNECRICGCTSFHIYKYELKDYVHCNNCGASCFASEVNIKEEWKRRVF